MSLDKYRIFGIFRSRDHSNVLITVFWTRKGKGFNCR